MTTPQQQILDKCNEVFAIAKAKFGLDMSKVNIRFDLRGRAAGMACARGKPGWTAERTYSIRFNRDMLTRDAFEHVLNSTVPHEVAHIICFMNPSLGSGHNSGWGHVCTALGGTDKRCHSEKVVYGKGYTYEYTTTNGKTVRMGDKYHKDVQRGIPLTYKKGLGTVTAQCAYSIVGHQGRTLSTPIVKTSPTVTGVSSPALVRHTPAQSVIGVAATPVVQRTTGASKADMSRAIVLSGHNQGKPYEAIIAAIMAACSMERQLARAYYKNIALKLGIPQAA